jgi:hypothetical protein
VVTVARKLGGLIRGTIGNGFVTAGTAENGTVVLKPGSPPAGHGDTPPWT